MRLHFREIEYNPAPSCVILILVSPQRKRIKIMIPLEHYVTGRNNWKISRHSGPEGVLIVWKGWNTESARHWFMRRDASRNGNSSILSNQKGSNLSTRLNWNIGWKRSITSICKATKKETNPQTENVKNPYYMDSFWEKYIPQGGFNVILLECHSRKRSSSNGSVERWNLNRYI